MSDTNNNGFSECSRTDSNLPVLFANGYPTSLKNMKQQSLELFLPFLVQCSREFIDEADPDPPKWWPKDLDFKFPMTKPSRMKSFKWEEKLRKVVQSCYKESDNEYLLEYSEQLSLIPTEKLRYLTVSELTTSLYKKDDNERKLLITFRNENMLYDKKTKRMQLWHRTDPSSNEKSPSPEPDETEATFQIMLCDYCDAEFYSDEVLENHEAKCRDRGDSDDQEPDELEEKIIENIIISDDSEEEESIANVQCEFMTYFGLDLSSGTKPIRRQIRSISPKKCSPKKRAQKKKRIVVNKKEIDKERILPFSSPAGLLLLQKRSKEVNDEYLEQKFHETAAYCQARPNMKLSTKSRIFPIRQYIQNQLADNEVFDDMRIPRIYYWPKKTYKSTSREINFKFLNRSLIKQMKPSIVSLHKLSDFEISNYQETLRIAREEKKRLEAENCIAVIDSDDDEDDVQSREFGYFSSQSASIFPRHSRNSTSEFIKNEISVISTSSSSQISITKSSLSKSYIHSNVEKWIENVSNNPNKCILSNSN